MSDGVSFEAILKIAEIISVIGGGGLVVFRLGRTTSTRESAMKSQGTAIEELKEDVKIVGKLLTEVAVQKTRLDGLDQRIGTLDRRYEELRHGEGFVYPLGAHVSK